MRTQLTCFTLKISFVVLVLASLSCLNAVFTFCKKRHYRLFEHDVDTKPSTPSAHRVPIHSTPMSVSPMEYIKNLFANTTAESRAHAQEATSVWELAVWDPNPLCLRLFCLFSPGHVLVHHLFLPVDSFDPRPSVKVMTTAVVATLLSAQLLLLRRAFLRQKKDSAIIHQEVLHEYDTKYVHPSLQQPVRDVAIQTPPPRRRKSGAGIITEVDTYMPTSIINRGFRAHGNPYIEKQDADAGVQAFRPLHQTMHTPALRPTPRGQTTGRSTAVANGDMSSPFQPTNTPTRYRSQLRGGGDGGSLGVYSHAASPLRKAASAYFVREDERRTDRSSSKRERSPLKRTNTPSGRGAATFGETEDRIGKAYSGLGVGRRESGRF